MPVSPYFNLIQKYFPPSEWDRADCISAVECPSTRAGYPKSCVASQGLIACGSAGAVQSYSYGPFQILDACWNPALNPTSPFTREQWARVLDPEMNTWMASVIWSIGGWSMWTVCGSCDACTVPGGKIPLPNYDALPPIITEQATYATPFVVTGVVALIGTYLIAARRR